MKIEKCHLVFIALLIAIVRVDAQSSIGIASKHYSLSAIRGTTSKPDTLSVRSTTGVVHVKWISGDSSSFLVRMISSLHTKQKQWELLFKPNNTFTGLTAAKFELVSMTAKTLAIAELSGLSTQALEGENEAPLSKIVQALGYQTNIGWTGLANHCRPELQGDELKYPIFRKAGKGKVEMIPVARYSHDFELPFGYYLLSADGPVKQEVGVLSKAGKFPEHQTLFPAMANGNIAFEPGEKNFGFYATGPTHSAYSEDVWNMLLHHDNAVHATRIYLLKDQTGKQLQNQYLVCFEEAKNGDYNDYVFLVKNITPVEDDFYTTIFNGKNLNGWHTFIKDKENKEDSENFRIEDDALHVNGKELGYAITEKSWQNFHLKVDFKWGEKKWPPRQNEKRDAGICYNIPVNEPDSIWPASIECQVQEGDVGDFWLLGMSTIMVDGKINKPSAHTRAEKKKDAEKPNGEWNTIEIISYNGTCVHIVNGTVVNYGTNASLKGGRILLQSEYAEVYYRNVRIRGL
ncbi:MAG: DUF1080 domain-containing protein [Chitinophagaceae bacterium]